MSKAGTTDRKPLGTGGVVFLSFLCVILVFLSTALLLGCVTARQALQPQLVNQAAADIALGQVILPDGTSLPQYINENYFKDAAVPEEKLANILRDGTFSTWNGKMAEALASYLNGQTQTIPQITPDEVEQLLAANDSTIQLHTGIHDFYEENPRIIERIKPDIASVNSSLNAFLEPRSLTGKLTQAVVSDWGFWVPGGLLILLLVLLMVIHVRGRRHLGTAFKTFAVSAFLPSLAVFLAGTFGTLLLGKLGMGAFGKAFADVHTIPMMTGGFGALACAALFGFGVLWNTIASNPMAAAITEREPAAEEAPAPSRPVIEIVSEPELPAEEPEATAPVQLQKPETPEEPAAVRHFCRFCGEVLINSDAKFCYKCGRPQ